MQEAQTTPPHRVPRPVMHQQWRRLAYLHWPYPAEVVRATLPAGLDVDTFDGAAWIGLVPFHMVGIRPAKGPAIPYLGTFPETNVRTYVTGSDGPGVWFYSLDITRLLPVVVARAAYRLPYMWADMAIRTDGLRVVYETARRWPRPNATSHVEIEVGPAIDEPSELDVFLSARWRLYTLLGDRLAYARVEHEPWPLRSARAIHLNDELIPAAGFAAATGEAHVLYSPGVTVRVERPRRA